VTRKVYSEYRTYSPIKDCLISRISMADERGGEFWMEIDGDGKTYREARDRALADIQEAIERGLLPGKVETQRA
jgi:hypothetical protein